MTNHKVRHQIVLNKMTNHRSIISKATSKAYMNSTQKNDQSHISNQQSD